MKNNIRNKESNYKKDYRFGDLAEKEFLKFYKYLNRFNQNDEFFHIGYTETIKEVREKIRKTNKLGDYEASLLKLKNKILENYNNILKLTEESIFFKKHYDLELKEMYSNKLKKLFIYCDETNEIVDVNENYRLQMAGVDFVVLKQDKILYNYEINFIEVKSFKAVRTMYKKLGIEFFSKFTKDEKVVGYTFSMLCDYLVYRQDVDGTIDNRKGGLSNIKTKRDLIDDRRKNNEIHNDLFTNYTVFNNYNFTKQSIEYTNNLEKVVFHSRTTNGGYKSNYINIDYKYFSESTIKRYKWEKNKIVKKEDL